MLTAAVSAAVEIASKGRDSMSRKVTLGGILTALCVVLAYLAFYLPTGKLSIYLLTSVVIAIAVVELGIKFSTVVYTASAILIFLLTGSINVLLLFTLFFGSYPLLKYYIEKQRNAVIEMLLKFSAFNLIAIFVFFIFKQLLGVMPIRLNDLSIWMQIGIIFGAQVVFLIYDYVLSRLIDYYFNRIKPGLHKK